MFLPSVFYFSTIHLSIVLTPLSEEMLIPIFTTSRPSYLKGID